jgi:hypothetical protein
LLGFGSGVCVGGALMAINYDELGKLKEALLTLGLSFIAVTGMTKLRLVFGLGVAFALFVLQPIVMFYLARKLQSTAIEARRAESQLASRWRAAGISLVCLPFALGCAVLAHHWLTR